MDFLNFFTKRAKGNASKRTNFGGFGTEESPSVSMDSFYNLYRTNGDLRRCIEEKQDTAGNSGYVIYKGEGKNKKVIKDNKINEFLNNQRDFDELKNVIIRDLDISGNVFLEIVKNTYGQVVGFDYLDPRTISIAADEHGNIVRYFQKTSGKSIEFSKDEILHFKDKVDMDNDIFGISKVETLIYDLMGDKEASVTNYSFFKNNATPSQLIVLENDLDEDETNVAIERLKRQFSGGKNKHKMSIGNGIKEIKQIGSSQKDMEFIEYRKFNTERICAVMGVPKIILNYTDGVNYSNSDTQYKKFIENSIRPLENKLEIIFTKLINLVAPEYKFEFINGHIYNQLENARIYQIMASSGFITANEARQKLGFELSNDENANKLVIDLSNVPSDSTDNNLK